MEAAPDSRPSADRRYRRVGHGGVSVRAPRVPRGRGGRGARLRSAGPAHALIRGPATDETVWAKRCSRNMARSRSRLAARPARAATRTLPRRRRGTTSVSLSRPSVKGKRSCTRHAESDCQRPETPRRLGVSADPPAPGTYAPELTSLRCTAQTPRSLRRRTFAAQYGSPAHALSFVSGRLRRSAERGRFSAVGEQEGEFGP